MTSSPLPLFLPWIVLSCAVIGSTIAQNPILANANLGNLVLQNQQLQQARQVQQLQQLQAAGDEFGSYPRNGRLVNELEHNEKSLAELEYDQSNLQAKIAKSKTELAHHNSIVETLEEKQRMEIGRLQGKIQNMKRYIANMEVSKEELRQKLLVAAEKSIYGDQQLVEKVAELQQKNQLLLEHNRQLVAKIHQLVNSGLGAPPQIGGVFRHPMDLNGDGLVDVNELGLSAGATEAQLRLQAALNGAGSLVDVDGDGLADLSLPSLLSPSASQILLEQQAAAAAAASAADFSAAQVIGSSPSLEYLLHHRNRHLRHKLVKSQYGALKSLGLLPGYYNNYEAGLLEV